MLVTVDGDGFDFLGDGLALDDGAAVLAVCTHSVGLNHLVRSLNNGATWTGVTVAAGVATSPAFVRYFPEVELFITALSNEIYTSGDGGTTWTKRYSSPGITLFHDVAKKPGGNFVAVGVLAANGTGKVTYSADGITWLDTACAVSASCNALTSIDYDGTAGLFLTVERCNGTTDERKLRISPQGTAWSAGATMVAQSDGNSATRVRAHGGLFFLDVARSAGQSRSFITANGTTLTSPPGFLGTPLWGVAGLGMVFLVAATGSATYRPHLRVTNDDGATASTLSDWLELSADTSPFNGNLLPALAGGAVLSCAVGGNTAFFTNSTAQKSMRVPMLTRVH